MKTRTELAQEFILEMESVLDNMTPLDKDSAQARMQCKKLLKKSKDWEQRGTILALYLGEVAGKSEVVNAELTRLGRDGDKSAQAKWTSIYSLVFQLNKTGGSYGNPIAWTVSKA